MIIAVDGTAASGKGTIARALAEHFGLPYLDTGLLYRAVGWQVKLNSGNPDYAPSALAACDFPEHLLDNPELRSEEAGKLASRVSIHPEVRKALYARQRAFATQPGGAVLDGRDIGTVIAPEAEVKIFVIADIRVRATRRYEELKKQGSSKDFAWVGTDLELRDKRDSTRAEAPLRAAADAVVLDNSDMTKDQSIARAIAIVEETRTKG